MHRSSKSLHLRKFMGVFSQKLSFSRFLLSELLEWLAVFRHAPIGEAKHRFGHVGLLFFCHGFKWPPEAVSGEGDRGGLRIHGRVNNVRAGAEFRRDTQAALTVIKRNNAGQAVPPLS